MATSSFYLTISNFYSHVDDFKVFNDKDFKIGTFDRITYTTNHRAFSPREEIDEESRKEIFKYLRAFSHAITVFSDHEERDEEGNLKWNTDCESFVKDAFERTSVFLFKTPKQTEGSDSGSIHKNTYGCFALLIEDDTRERSQDKMMCTFFNRAFDLIQHKALETPSCGLMSFLYSVYGVYNLDLVAHDKINKGNDSWEFLMQMFNEKKAIYGTRATFDFTVSESEEPVTDAKASFDAVKSSFKQVLGYESFDLSDFKFSFSEESATAESAEEGEGVGDDDDDWETDDDDGNAEAGAPASSVSSMSTTERLVQIFAERMRRDAEAQEERISRRNAKEIEKTVKELPPREAIDISGDCLICLSNPKTVAVVPCGHVVCCDPCSVNLNKMALTDKTTCPVCRSEAIAFLKLFA